MIAYAIDKFLDKNNWNIKDLSYISGIRVGVLRQIIDGECEITISLAVRLSNTIGHSPEFWYSETWNNRVNKVQDKLDAEWADIYLGEAFDFTEIVNTSEDNPKQSSNSVIWFRKSPDEVFMDYNGVCSTQSSVKQCAIDIRTQITGYQDGYLENGQ